MKLLMGLKMKFSASKYFFFNRYKPWCSNRCCVSSIVLSWRSPLISTRRHGKWYVVVLHELYLCMSAEDHEQWKALWHVSTFKWDWLLLTSLIYRFLFYFSVQELILSGNLCCRPDIVHLFSERYVNSVCPPLVNRCNTELSRQFLLELFSYSEDSILISKPQTHKGHRQYLQLFVDAKL